MDVHVYARNLQYILIPLFPEHQTLLHLEQVDGVARI